MSDKKLIDLPSASTPLDGSEFVYILKDGSDAKTTVSSITSNGTSGTSGTSSTSGTSGTSGNGTSGTSGTSGINGTSGVNGTSGINGTSGTSGLFAVQSFDIGDWNMDSTNSVTITISSFDVTKIRKVNVSIRADDDAFFPFGFYQEPFFDGSDVIQLVKSVVSTSGSDILITIRRTVGGTFDSTDFDDTSFNRGWIIIEYIP